MSKRTQSRRSQKNSNSERTSAATVSMTPPRTFAAVAGERHPAMSPVRPVVGAELDVASLMLRLRADLQREVGVIDADRDMSTLVAGSTDLCLDEFLEIANEDFVELAFETILRRNVDNRAFYFYMRQADAGRSRLDVLSELLSSGEAKEKSAAEKSGTVVLRQHDSLRAEIEVQRGLPAKSGAESASLAVDALEQRAVDIAPDRPRGDVAEEVMHGLSNERKGQRADAPLNRFVPQPSRQRTVANAEVDVEAIFVSLKNNLVSGAAVPSFRANAVDARSRNSADSSSLVSKSAPIPQLHFSGGGTSLVSQRFFRVEELLWGADKTFLDRAYEALLGRKPDADGESHYLQMLSDGVVRVEVLASILRSREARHRRVKVLGIRGRHFVARLAKWPVFGSLFKRIADRSAANYVHVSSLRSLYDEDFVHHVYRAILGRAPDPNGGERYVSALRNGEDKVRLIWDVRQSKEGRQRGVHVGGLLPAYIWQVITDTPFISACGLFVVSLLKSPQSRRAARVREARTERMFTSLSHNMSAIQKTVNSGFGTLKQAIDDVALQTNVLAEVEKSGEQHAYLKELVQRIAILETQSDSLRDNLIQIAATDRCE